MKHSFAAQALLLLTLIAGIAVTDAARDRITVDNYGIEFNIDWWDDGRRFPYRVSFIKRGISSVYRFNAAGRLARVFVSEAAFGVNMGIQDSGETADVYSLPDPSERMLLPMQEGTEADEMELDYRRDNPYFCSDCEQTWELMCDVGLKDVCFLVDKFKSLLRDDTQRSLKRMCKRFAKECDTPAGMICDGICTPGPCEPNPCQNGGSCSIDRSGGHVCSCAFGFGGMACQTNTRALAPFYIDISYAGTWTEARKAVFQSAADKWSRVITHVPCGGAPGRPAGRLLIHAWLVTIDGEGGALGSARPYGVWWSCRTISYVGVMKFDIEDIDNLEADGTLEGVILHEMGHVIGVGTLWGPNLGGCSSCHISGSPAWTCPAAVSVFADLGGSGADIIELDGATGTECGHLDEVVFEDELMTGYVDYEMYLSKMTAAILEDLHYTVDPSAVDAYTLPSKRGPSAVSDSLPLSIPVVDVAVDAIVVCLDAAGNVVEEIDGIMMEF